MRFAKTFLAVWGCVVTVPLIYLLFVYLDREGIIEFRVHHKVDYYYPADLQTMRLPRWNLTNAIPLSPDAAIQAAMRYATDKHPGITSWDTDRVAIQAEGNNGIWSYEICLVERQSGRYEQEDVRVLMDGSIWKPTLDARKR